MAAYELNIRNKYMYCSIHVLYSIGLLLDVQSSLILTSAVGVYCNLCIIVIVLTENQAV